jgi:LuxR family maltose regulon positive regulatory protein
VHALALKAQGKTRESQTELEQAVEQSKPGGTLRPFVDLGADMQEMLGELAQKNHSIETIHTILAAFPDQVNASKTEDEQPGSNHRSIPGYPTLIEPLTPREIQIIRYLQEPVSIKEIARKLDIRYATAKRHSINIYGKFGVNSRWDAVAKAIDLGILPTR